MDLITGGKPWRGAKLLSLPQAGPEDVVHPASVKQNPFNHTPLKTEHTSSRPGLGAAAANASGQTTDIRQVQDAVGEEISREVINTVEHGGKRTNVSQVNSAVTVHVSAVEVKSENATIGTTGDSITADHDVGVGQAEATGVEGG